MTTSVQDVRTATGGASIAVDDLWKVYGSHVQDHLAAARAGESEDKFDGTAAVRGVSFDVNAGETFVVMGLSGSGKSTLVRCLTRLVEPTAGKIDIDGVDVVGMSAHQLCETRRKDWAMVFQHFGLLPHRRILQNVGYGLEVGGMSRKERDARAREMIDLVGLSGVTHKLPHELSGGMKQRVGLARALAVHPKLLLLDEPFSALDPLIRTDLQDQLLRLKSVINQTAIFITHDLSEALKMGDRIAIMRNGELVQVGTPEEIVLQPKDDYVRRFAIEAPRAKVVRAGTALTPTVVLSGSEPVDQALETVSNAGCGSAIVDGPAPYVVTENQLLLARVNNLRLQDVAKGDFAIVEDDAKLAEVMAKLVATNNPVIVKDAQGALHGIVTNSAAVRALSIV